MLYRVVHQRTGMTLAVLERPDGRDAIRDVVHALARSLSAEEFRAVPVVREENARRTDRERRAES
ncbi:MAG: hypothetical protein ABJD11_14220 [Gemmatimonadota bacterium]